jgi:hypothetical protein
MLESSSRSSRAPVDLKPLNDNIAARKLLLGIGGFGLALLLAAMIAGAYPLERLLAGTRASNPTNTIGLDVLFLCIFAGIGTLLLLTAVTSFRTKAESLVFDGKGMTLCYPSGRERSWRWVDPNLDAEFVVYVMPPGLAMAGERMVRIGSAFSDKTFLPPTAFGEIQVLAERAGVRISRSAKYIGVPGTGFRVRFSCAP